MSGHLQGLDSLNTQIWVREYCGNREPFLVATFLQCHIYTGRYIFLCVFPVNVAFWKLLITLEIFAAERLRLMGFDDRLIIDCLANVVNLPSF